MSCSELVDCSTDQHMQAKFVESVGRKGRNEGDLVLDLREDFHNLNTHVGFKTFSSIPIPNLKILR